MESYFNTTLNINQETDNTLYNIINSADPKQIFLYGLIIVVITFISTKIILQRLISHKTKALL
jgi:hypothetical protein